MTSAKATEFLTKQLCVEKETVTFRWLSRKLSVHVNVAKNELASFYASSRATDVQVHATYLLTGDVTPIKAAGSYRDNDDDGMDVEEDTQESVATRKIFLVGEDDLEAAKAQFTRAPSVHIYSLSPSAIRDAAILAPMADRVRPDDVSKGMAYNQTIGIVVGPDVKIGQTSKPGTSKLAKTRPSVASFSKLNPSVTVTKAAENPKRSEKRTAPEKPKQDEKKKGTLDWSKAKVKGENEKEVVKKESKSALKETGQTVKPEVKKDENTKAKVKKDESTKAKAKKETSEAKVSTRKVIEDNKPKQGTKRPSAVMSLSDSEDENPSPKTKRRTSATPLPSRPPSRASGVKVKKGVLLSDDDEESAQEVKPRTSKQKGKGRARVAEKEEEEEEDVDPSIRAMMDLDDSQVTRHNNRVSAPDHQSDGDMEMLSDDEPVPERPKTKKKPKKVIPVGKNGLPKRRVLKSRKSKNAKGYTVTEDYSSYESVSEAEQAQAPSDMEKKPTKGRKKSKKKEDTDNSGTAEAKGKTASKDKVDDHSAKIEGEAKSETKKPSSGSGGGGSTSKFSAKASNGGKNNLMSYFAKK